MVILSLACAQDAPGTCTSPLDLTKGDFTDSQMNTIQADLTDGTFTGTCFVPPPCIQVAKSVQPGVAKVGDAVVYTICIQNCGDVILENIMVDDSLLGDLSGSYADTLSPGETECHDFTYIVKDTDPNPLINEVTVTCQDASGLEAMDSNSATVQIVPGGEATRTQGFWKNRCEYTQTVLGYLGGTIDLGWKTLDSPGDVFGMFLAGTSKESDGSKRDKVCQAQVIGSRQLLAAILNTGLPNDAVVPMDPVTGDDLITAMRSALANCDRAEIMRLEGLLEAYNSSGEYVVIDDDVSGADPKCASKLATTSIADCVSCP